MKKIQFGPNFTVFAIFFGIAVLDSFASRNILWIVFWLFMGAVFLAGDNIRKRS